MTNNYNDTSKFNHRQSIDTPILTMDNLRILIIANDPLARAGLAALLDNRPNCTLLGQLAVTTNLPAETDIYRPDTLLWDLGWAPLPEEIEMLSLLTDLDTPTVVLLPNQQFVTEVREAGVQGLLPRNANANKILAALHAVSYGLIAIDPSLTEDRSPATSANLPSLAEPLTPRESEVLQLLAEGLPNKAIAYKLDISEHTVIFHVNAIMGKLSAQSRTEAVVRATQLGLIFL